MTSLPPAVLLVLAVGKILFLIVLAVRTIRARRKKWREQVAAEAAARARAAEKRAKRLQEQTQ